MHHLVKAKLQDVRYQPKDRLELFVPPHLLPAFSAPPLAALVHLHDPIELSLVVLQPVISASSITSTAQVDTDDLDLDHCYGSQRPPVSNGTFSGINGHARSFHPPRIFRQDATITMPRHDGTAIPMRILTIDPVQQGILTPSTKVIVTSTPDIFDAEPQWNDMDGAISESSHGKTHLSLANFDPDAFLSSSLDLRFSQPSLLPDGSPLLENLDLTDSTYSSTSGSITPRPNGHTYTAPASPPAQVDEVLADGEEVEEAGTRFPVMVAAGPSITARGGNNNTSEDDVCWMGVGGLGRAGIFEGDWVSCFRSDEGRLLIYKVFLRSSSVSESSSNVGRLVRALAWERLDEEDPEL